MYIIVIFKDLKKQMLLPIKEYIINKKVNIRGKEVLLLSFTLEKDNNSLWLMYEDDKPYKYGFNDGEQEESEDSRKEFETNREKFLNDIENRWENESFYIKKAEIQGHTVTFNSSSSCHIHDMKIEAKMQLQHFAEKGLFPEEWYEKKLEDIVISRYEQLEGEALPDIDEGRDLSVVLHIDKMIKEVPIQHAFNLKFGKQEAGTRISYFDEYLGREIYFYVNEIYSYDPYEDIIEKVKHIEDEVRKDIIQHFNKALANVCPRDKNLAVIKYESPYNMQFCFMLKDYLEAQPVHSNSNSATAIGFICKNDGTGINGYDLKESVMQSIDKDFNGHMEIELFSKYIEIPEETILVCR